jgi:hypothetical protein
MAERVKRRVAAARLAVAFVAAGTIAGAAWAQAGPPPPTAQSSASDIFAKLGDIKIDSSNVDNGSLLYKDFKKGQIPSFAMFDKLNDAFFKYKKAVNEYKPQLAGQLDTIKGELDTIKGELGGYIKTTDADARYIKMNDAIMGDGSVFTATKAVSAQNMIRIVEAPGMFTVDAQGPTLTITNTGSSDLDHTACGAIGAGTLKPGENVGCATGEHSDTLQLVNGDGRVATLNFSQFSGQVTVQILVGL